MPEYAVRVVTDVRLDPDATDAWDALTDALGGHPHHASLSAPDGRLAAQLTVDAARHGAEVVLRAVARHAPGADLVEVVSVEVCTPEEFSRRVEPVDIEDLITTQDAAELLGVSRQRVAALRARPDFPAPVPTEGRDLLWSRRALEAWNAGADRSRGRPRTTTREDA